LLDIAIKQIATLRVLPQSREFGFLKILSALSFHPDGSEGEVDVEFAHDVSEQSAQPARMLDRKGIIKR
jgi:hypothetical protein